MQLPPNLHTRNRVTGDATSKENTRGSLAWSRRSTPKRRRSTPPSRRPWSDLDAAFPTHKYDCGIGDPSH